MTISPQKRQKQLAKKKAKRKQVEFKRSASKATLSVSSINIGDIPIYESRISKSISQFGMGTVLLSRKIAPGYVSAAFFMVDTFCLGVKRANFGNLSLERYRQIVEDLSQRESFINVPPQCVRKLVERAIDYAKDLGFRPPSSYHEAQKIFANIDPESCTEEFTFGYEGKPCYVVGPFDKSIEAKRIIEKLRRRCGLGGFKVFLPVKTEPGTEQKIPAEPKVSPEVLPPMEQKVVAEEISPVPAVSPPSS